MNIRLVIFDFDGTLADTKSLIVATKQETMRRMGLKVENEDVCASTIGLPLKKSYQVMYPEFDEKTIDECVATYRAVFDEIKDEHPPVMFPGVKEVLSALREKSIKTTIATSRRRDSLIDFLNEWDITEYFPYVLGGDDTARNKPDPEPVIKTLNDLSVKADEALVVGDMSFDIEMGNRAGAYTCGVTYGNASAEALSEAKADYMIDNAMDLLDLLNMTAIGSASF